MSIYEYEQGDVMECPNCGKEFTLENIDEDELDDFDAYFEHVTTCEGESHDQ